MFAQIFGHPGTVIIDIARQHHGGPRGPRRRDNRPGQAGQFPPPQGVGRVQGIDDEVGVLRGHDNRIAIKGIADDVPRIFGHAAHQ